jgi:hypothetical protein
MDERRGLHTALRHCFALQEPRDSLFTWAPILQITRVARAFIVLSGALPAPPLLREHTI